MKKVLVFISLFWTIININLSATQICPTLVIPPLADTSICAAQVLSISAPAGYEKYIWSNGDTTQFANISTPGHYYVEVIDDMGCAYNTSVNVSPNGPLQSSWLAAKSLFLNTGYYIQETDYADNAYLAAYMNSATDTIRIGAEKIYSEKTENEIVLIKFDSQSNKQWVKKINIPGADLYMRSMCFDPSGNIYFGGYYTNAFSFNGVDYPENDYFIIKTDSTLAIQWISTGGISTTGGDVILDIEYKNDKLYILGEVAISGSYLISNITNTSFGEGTFAACINASDASFNWVNVINNDLSTSNSKSILLDSEDNVYINARLTNRNLSVNGVSVPNEFYKASMYSKSNYIARFSKEGQFKWIKNVVAPCIRLKAILTKNDELVLLGEAPATFNLYDTIVNFPSTQFMGGSFIAKYDSLGVLKNYRTLNSVYKDITVLPSGELCVMGNLNSGVAEVFGKDSLTENYGVEERFFVGIMDADLEPIRAKSYIGTFGASNAYGIQIKSLLNGKLSVFGEILSAQDYPYETYVVKDEEFDSLRVSRKGVNFIVAVLEPSKLSAWEPFVLPKDTAFCLGQEIKLSVPKSFTNINWSNGSNESSVTLNSSSSIYFSAQDLHGCPLVSDTFNLTVHPLPKVNLGNDTTINTNNFLILFAGLHSSYLWHDGSQSAMNTIGLNVSSGTHSAWVQVTDTNACVNSDTITIVFKEPTAIEDVSIKSIHLYPNPVEDVLNIESGVLIDKVEIYSNSGTKMYAKDLYTNTATLNLSDLASGVYALLIYKDGKPIKSLSIVKK